MAANDIPFPAGIVLGPGGGIRMGNGGVIEPRMAREDVLEKAATQTFTIPMTCWREHDGYATALPSVMKAGSGITSATGEICEHLITRVGRLIKTEILVDVTGLNDGGTAGDIIGKDGGTANCHIGQITAALNGTIVCGRITCFETPAGGDADIDLWYADEATGAQDAAITGLTGEIQCVDHGDWAAEAVDYLTALPPANKYLYLVNGDTTDANYTAGIFLVELWGTTSVNNHLDLIAGTHGTNAPSLQTDDFGGNGGATSYYARGEIQLPWEYVSAGTVKIRVHAGMLTTAADQACTVDLEVYKSDEDSTSTGDLCTTDAQSMNALAFADLDFTITATTLNPGDLLDVRITVSADDDGDAGVMKACIGAVQLLADVR